MHNELPGKAVEGISGYGRSCIGCPAKVIFDVDHSFPIDFALYDMLLQPLLTQKMPQVYVCCFPSAFTECPCDLGVAPKYF